MWSLRNAGHGPDLPAADPMVLRGRRGASPRSAWQERRKGLLLTVSVVVLSAASAAPLLAQQTGGNGGSLFTPGNGPAGGSTDPLSGASTDGADGGLESTIGSGGGGGGAGVVGGAGGAGGPNSTGTPGAAGGAGGTAAVGGVGGSGGAGVSWSGAGVSPGGGGGGGGAHGVVDALLTGGVLSGGAGGLGGSSIGAGGGGGSGGYGAFVLASGGNSNQSVITGGNGGGGGDTVFVNGGDGGKGGVGMFFAAGGTLINGGVIAGGNGGVGGAATGGGRAGANGAGGAGVVGAGLTIDAIGGTISGGLSGDGVTRAAALNFTGGANELRLDATTILVGNINVANAGSTLTFNPVIDMTLSNAITGAGAVVQTANTLRLTGASTYTGGTTVSGGTLQIGNGGTAGSVAGDIINNSALAFSRSDAIGFGGVISGSGTVTQLGAGTLTLTGANTYTGGTTVSGGTLQIGNGGTSGAITGTIANNAALAFNRSDDVSFGGSIAGSGSLTKLGGNTLTLNGALTYTGATTVSAGTLQIGDGSSSGIVTIITTDITNNAALVFNRSDPISYRGVIDGSGSVTKLGSGDLLLSATSTYTGTTDVLAGRLRPGSGSVLSDSSKYNIAAGATLDLGYYSQVIGSLTGGGTVTNTGSAVSLFTGTDNTDATFAGVIQDGAAPLSLWVQGTGVTTLSGANTYSGGTTVLAGNLRVNGSVAGDVEVQGGATLSGIGSVGGAVTVQNAGTLSAGQSPGTLTLGALTLDASSTSVFELGAAGVVGGVANDLVSVTGNLTLGGTLAVNAPSAGYYRLFDYGTLTAGSAFAAVTGSTQGTPQVLTNIANQVNLLIAGAGQQVQFWDGADQAGNGTVNGGSGSWTVGTTNWTGAPGQAGINDQWRSSVGVFAGAAGGAVTVTGARAFDTLQFSTNGYVLGGSPLQLAGASNTGTINTDTGITATINSALVDGTAQRLMKAGGGTLVLTGTNPYSGGTTISAGTLQIGNGGTTGSIAGDVTSNAMLAFNRSDNIQFDGAIDGTGGISKLGAGTLSLRSGRNTYSGTTFVTAGTLTGLPFALSRNSQHAVAAGATIDLAGENQEIGSLTGNGTVTNSGFSARLGIGYDNTLAEFGGVLRDGAVTLSLEVAGTGSVLTGTNTYTGSTVIDGGSTLYLGNGGTSGSIVGNVSNNGTLVFRRSNSFAFDGFIQGTGQVLQDGLGNTTLSGINIYTGATTVNGGTLSVNGSIASSALTTVNASGTLGGTGTVGNTLINDGRLAPGNSIGTLNVTGNLTLTSAANYMVEVSTQAADRVNVTGTATLGGATVNASFAPGSYVTKQYTIVNAAGGVSGAFGSQVNTNLPANFTSSLAYDATNAYLNLTLNFVPPSPDPTPTPTPVPGFNAFSANQLAVANTLVNYFNRTGGIPLAFGALDAAGLTRVSGETATGSQQATFDAMNVFMGLMTDPFTAGRNEAGQGAVPYADETLSYAAKRRPSDALAAIYRKAPAMAPAFTPRWNVWAAGFGGAQTTGGNAATGSNTASSRLFGTAVGADYWLSPQTMAGFALAGGGTNFNVANAGSGRSDLFQAGAFVRHSIGAAYITAAAAYGWQDVTTDRGVGGALQGRFNANSYAGRIEAGNRVVAPWLGGIGVTPYAAAQVAAFDLPAYGESATGGNPFALSYGGKTVTATRSELGLRSDKTFALDGALLTLRGRAAWAHDYNTERSASATFQALPGASFVVNGASPARDAALTTASAEIGFRNGISLAASFEGEFSDVTRSYAGKGVVRYAW